MGGKHDKDLPWLEQLSLTTIKTPPTTKAMMLTTATTTTTTTTITISAAAAAASQIRTKFNLGRTHLSVTLCPSSISSTTRTITISSNTTTTITTQPGPFLERKHLPSQNLLTQLGYYQLSARKLIFKSV